EVEDGAEVDRERVLALPHEQAPGLAAAGDVDVVEVLAGIGGVVGNRLGADVVDRFVEGGVAAGGVGDRRAAAAAAVAAHDVDREGLVDVQRRGVRGTHDAG